MEVIISCIFFISGFIIFWAMIGYSQSLKLISKILNKDSILKNYELQPTVTLMVVAHNEEKVIKDKLENIIKVDYPKNKIDFLIVSDNSTDKTNDIVKDFIDKNTDFNIKLFEVKQRKGKTNAQNEAQKIITSEFIVMTDANSILDKKSIKELMASFTSNDIAYVTGRLSIINSDINEVSNAEANYWDGDLVIREIESRIQTITAGNGAIYACRTKDYYHFDPIESHDSAMPVLYALKGKKAIANHDAIAFEKAGEVITDEFGRKVRMNRVILRHILPSIKILNVFKYKWFSYFYFGHRTCRYLLWISHLALLISNSLLIPYSWFFIFTLAGQGIFYLVALLKLITNTKNKYIILIYYYCMTIFAQWIGVFNIITGKAKPFWEKAESTR